MITSSLLLLLALTPASAVPQRSSHGLTISTTSGRVQGFVSREHPDVRQWAGIPFAEPPVGALRWASPVPKGKSSRLVHTTSFKPQCQQWLSDNATVYNQYQPGSLPSPPYDEDCLYLNVFAPTKPKNKKLPVVVWVHGGELRYGGTHTPWEDPLNWVSRSEEHMVVQLAYRLNILGFPNARSLPSSLRNVGFQDMRLGLEWVRDNAAAFGGDPDRLIGWGHAAGAASLQILDFANPQDPILAGQICESASVALVKAEEDLNMTSFDTVASAVGCANLAGSAQLDCMRRVSATRFQQVLKDHNDRGLKPALAFSLSVNADGVYSAAEYVRRGRAGLFSKKPLLLGSDSDEGSAFVPFPGPGQPAPNATAVRAATLSVIQCAIKAAQDYRAAVGAKTHRYLYAGNFSNISPVPWLGASHFSIVPIASGAHVVSPLDGQGPSARQLQASRLVQDLWLAFAKDPAGEQLERRGWPASTPDADSSPVAVLARGKTMFQVQDAGIIDVGCPTS